MIENNGEYTDVLKDGPHVNTEVTGPSVPLNVHFSFLNTGLLLQWTKPLSNGGSPITKYSFIATPSNGSQTYGTFVNAPTTSVLIDYGYIYNFCTYQFVVAAINNINMSAYVGTNLIYILPTTPTNFTVKKLSNGYLLNWNGATHPGGLATTGFSIVATPKIANTGQTRTITTGVTNNYAFVTNVGYNFKVAQINEIGRGPYTNTLSATSVKPKVVKIVKRVIVQKQKSKLDLSLIKKLFNFRL
jgi:hypothetical protein